MRRATPGPLGRPGESLFAIRRGDVIELAFPEEEAGFAEADVFQPIPDSRKIEDLIGSGEFESSLSRKGDLRDAIGNLQWTAGVDRTIGGKGRGEKRRRKVAQWHSTKRCVRILTCLHSAPTSRLSRDGVPSPG